MNIQRVRGLEYNGIQYAKYTRITWTRLHTAQMMKDWPQPRMEANA